MAIWCEKRARLPRVAAGTAALWLGLLCAAWPQGQPPAPAPPALATPLSSPEAASLTQIEQHLKAAIPPGVEETRESVERYPLEPGASLSVFNEFGEVRVACWDEPVVELHARMRARAESPDTALRLAENIRVSVGRQADRMEVRSVLPGPPKPEGYLSAQVDFVLIVPREASLSVRNFFGDTSIEGVRGAVTVDAHFGAVTLLDLAAPAKVASRGEFPVKATRLRQGGVFDLRGAPAEFVETDGELRVYSFRGDVILRTPAPGARIDASVDSASLRALLSRQVEPDLTAASVYGDLSSALPVEESVQADRRMAWHRVTGATQTLMLQAAFGGVRIDYAEETAPESATTLAEETGKPFTEPESFGDSVADATRLDVLAAPGDVRIQGGDQDRFEVSAQRMTWVNSAADAPAALEALKVNVTRENGAIKITTVDEHGEVSPTPAKSRIDLDIRCPRGLGVDVRATNGVTLVSDLSGPVIVHQTEGSISAERVKSGLLIRNDKGTINAADCGGIEAVADGGNVVLKRMAGPIRVESSQGHILIESPQGPVTASHRNGDVRILALEGVLGAFDVRAETGAISLLMAPDSDVALFVKATRGMVHSAVPLQGMITKDRQEFSGRMKDGLFQVRLETTDGGIAID